MRSFANNPLERITAILLAAGESARMGRPKALLPWGQGTLLEYQLWEMAAAGVAESVVVLGAQEGELRPIVARFSQARAVLNPDYLQGKTTSIVAGLRALGAVRHLLVLAVDQPRPREVLQALLRHHLDSGAAITVPTYRGRRGHPILFRGDLLGELLEIREETLGLREVLVRRRCEVSEVTTDSPTVLVDLNDPAQYEEARRLFGIA